MSRRSTSGRPETAHSAERPRRPRGLASRVLHVRGARGCVALGPRDRARAPLDSVGAAPRRDLTPGRFWSPDAGTDGDRAGGSVGGPERASRRLCENGPVSDSTFSLTEVQQEFRETLRAFGEEKVAPNAAEADRNAEYPWKSFEACKEMELPGLGIPEAYGGAGADSITQAIAVEELSRVCASTALILLINKLSMIPVMNWGSEELKRAYLPRNASGEIQGSYCLSEPDAGSDAAALRTRRARRRRLHPDRHEVLDQQRRGLGRLHRLRQDRSRRRRPGRVLLPRREGMGRARPEARGQARHAGQPDW